MARVCLSILSLFIVVAALPGAGAQPPKEASPPPREKPLPEVRIGLPDVLFRDVSPAMVDLAMVPFKDMIQKTLEMNGSLIKARDYKVLAEQLKKKQVDLVLLHGFEYAWVKEIEPDLNLIPLAVTLPNCGKVQACLVVHDSCQAKLPKDLTGACVAVPKGSKAHCQMFLEHIRKGLPEGDCCPSEVKGPLPTPEDVLDGIASGCGASKAALVDISSLEAYQADKPGLGSNLKILAKSELLPAAVIACRKDTLTAKQMDAITKGLVECTNNPKGRLFVMFWNLKGFGKVTPEYLDLVAKTQKAYPVPANPKK